MPLKALNLMAERSLDALDRLHQLRAAIRDIVIPALRSVAVAGIRDQRASDYFLEGLKSLAGEAQKKLEEEANLLLSEQAKGLDLNQA